MTLRKALMRVSLTASESLDAMLSPFVQSIRSAVD